MISASRKSDDVFGVDRMKADALPAAAHAAAAAFAAAPTSAGTAKRLRSGAWRRHGRGAMAAMSSS